MKKLLYNIITHLVPAYLKMIYGMDIGRGTIVHFRARLDKNINPKGVHIGANCRITRDVVILTHDHCRGLKKDTFIGNNCVIGIRSIILPGVTIGNHVVVGAGSVVTKDIPSHSIVAGNPARILKEGSVMVDNKGRIISS